MAGVSEVFNLDFKFGGNSEFLSRLEKLLERVDARFESTSEDISDATDDIKEMADAVDDLNDSFKDGVSSLNSFGEKLKDIAQYYLSFQALRTGAERIWSFGMQSMDAYSTQERAENQLKGVMKNRGTLDQFQTIKDYAAEVQGRSIYGDEAMIKGAGELATYVKGTESLKSMMDLLTDYAAGMTGGGEVSPEQMESLATGLGMAYDGNYMAMRRKGFDTSKLEALDALQESGGVWNAKMLKKYGSDWSKEEIRNFEAIAKEARKVGGITEQMRVDALRDALGDWEGLSDAVNNLDSSALIRFNNKLGDLRENLGKKIYPVFNKLVDTVDKHMPDIEDAFNSIGEIFESIVKAIDDHFDEIKAVVKTFSELVRVAAEFPKTSVAVGLAFKAISSGAFSASGQFGSLAKQISITTKEALNFNSAVAVMAGVGIGVSGTDTGALEGRDGNGLVAAGGVLGSVGMAALAGAQAFGVFGAAVAAAGASVGAALKTIWDEYQAAKRIQQTEHDSNEKDAMMDTILRLQRTAKSARKKKKAVRKDKNGEWIWEDDTEAEKRAIDDLKREVDAYEKIYGVGSAGTGVRMTIKGGYAKYQKKLEADAKAAAKNAAVVSKGDIHQTFNNTNITQNVSLAADIQKVGILLNQNIRSLIEKQMRQNREVSLSSDL